MKKLIKKLLKKARPATLSVLRKIERVDSYLRRREAEEAYRQVISICRYVDRKNKS